MTIKTIEGLIEKYEQSEFTLKKGPAAGKTFVSHKLSVRSEDGSLVKVEKDTIPTTNLGLEEGNKIRVTYDTQTGKVEKDQMGGPKNLVILDTEGNQEHVESKPEHNYQAPDGSTHKSVTKILSDNKATLSKKDSYVSNSEGQRKGMLFNNA